MAHKSKKLLLVLFIWILLVLAGYYLLAFYYRDTFSFNTWINGVYCTGKSVEDVNAELVSRLEAPVIVVTDKEGVSYEISLEDAEYHGDYLLPLVSYQREQNPYLWIDNITLHKNHTLLPTVTYNEEKLQKLWEALPFVKAERQKEEGLSIGWSQQKGYFLKDGLHDRIHLEKAYEMLLEAIQEGDTTLTYDGVLYYDLVMTAEQQKTWQLWERISSFQSKGLCYDMGEDQVRLEEADMSFFLQAEDNMVLTDAEGRLMLDESAISEFVVSLAEKYDTVGKEREFLTSEGDTVMVSGGIYGTRINQKEEKAFLTDYLSRQINNIGVSADKSGEEEISHKPSYEQTSLFLGENDIGDTYIEVDMTNQMLYFYQNGLLQLETEIVTGNMRRRMGTPAGVNYVYNKQKNRTLRGEGYASFVKYWMPVKGNIGIHDAGWRDEFGGEIYQTAGSHGCINLPSEMAGELYDAVEIGTPVVMFYRD